MIFFFQDLISASHLTFSPNTTSGFWMSGMSEAGTGAPQQVFVVDSQANYIPMPTVRKSKWAQDGMKIILLLLGLCILGLVVEGFLIYKVYQRTDVRKKSKCVCVCVCVCLSEKKPLSGLEWLEIPLLSNFHIFSYVMPRHISVDVSSLVIINVSSDCYLESYFLILALPIANSTDFTFSFIMLFVANLFNMLSAPRVTDYYWKVAIFSSKRSFLHFT